MTSSTIRGVNDIAREINAVGGSAGGRSTVNWENYNFPPFIRVIHFDLDELDAAPRVVVRWCYWSYKVLMFGVFLNFITTVVLAGGGVPGKGLQVAYSIFNFILAACLGLYCLHAGYKGVATADSSLMRRYVGLQAVLALLMFLFSLLSVVNWNGWMRIPEALHADVQSMRVFWTVMCCLESFTWTLGYLLTGVALYHVLQFEANGPMAFSSKASKAMGKAKSAAGMARKGSAGAAALGGVAMTKI